MSVQNNEPSHQAIAFRLTPALEDDYTARGVFPEIRRGRGERKGTAYVLHIDLAQAAALLEDARQRRALPEYQRGSANMFNAVIRDLEPKLWRFQPPPVGDSADYRAFRAAVFAPLPKPILIGWR